MNLKQIINRRKMYNPAIGYAMDMPEEPMIYSIRFPVGKRQWDSRYFRNKKFKSMIKCQFQAQYKRTTPVVVIVKFYVSAPAKENISAEALRKEKTPAVGTHEICEYLLSFIEILHKVLFTTYRQIVKIDAEKFYSNKPRTTFKFMSWSQYGEYQVNDPANATTKGERAIRKKRLQVQSERERHEEPQGVCEVVPTFD